MVGRTPCVVLWLVSPLQRLNLPGFPREARVVGQAGDRASGMCVWCVLGRFSPVPGCGARSRRDDCCPSADITIGRQTVDTEERLERAGRGHLCSALSIALGLSPHRPPCTGHRGAVPSTLWLASDPSQPACLFGLCLPSERQGGL